MAANLRLSAERSCCRGLPCNRTATRLYASRARLKARPPCGGRVPRALTRARLAEGHPDHGLTMSAPVRAGITQVLSVSGAMIVEGAAFRLGSQTGKLTSA